MRLSRIAFITLGALPLLLVPADAASGAARCTEVGAAGKDSAFIPLSRLLADASVYSEALVTTEGFVSFDAGFLYVCRDAQADLPDCLRLIFDEAALGAPKDDLTRLLGQWYGLSARFSGRFSALPDGVIGPRGDLEQVSGARLVGPPPDDLFCLENLDAMPHPTTPHDYLGGQTRREIRCGPKDRDAEGKLVCLDNWEPWVWIEKDGGFEKYIHDWDTRGMEIVALGDGRFVAIVVPVSRWVEFLTDQHTESGDEPALAELAVWTEGNFVDVSSTVVEVAVSFHSRATRRVIFAELAEGEGNGSVISIVEGDGSVEQLWRGEFAEVTELLDWGDELIVTIQEKGEAKRFRLSLNP